MDVGGILRSAREQRGLSLDDLTRRTKISLRFLHAVENNDFAALPGGLFTRGFLRAYAREVGVDPDAIVNEYITQYAPPPVEPAPDQEPDRLVDERPRVLADAVFAIAALALGVMTYLWVSASPADAPSAGAPSTAGVVASSGSDPGQPTATTAAAADLPTPVATAGTGIEIAIRPTGDCWVEAIVDGEVRLYRLMRAGDQATIAGREQIVLRVGEPSTFVFTINGSPGRPVGRRGQPATVRISSANAAAFVG